MSVNEMTNEERHQQYREQAGYPPAAPKPGSSKGKKIAKWVAIGIGTLIVIGMVAPDETKQTKDASGTSAPVAQSEPQVDAESSNGVSVEPKPLGPKALLAQTASKVFAGDTNYDKPRLKQTSFEKIGKGWTAFVTFRADDNLTTGLRKTGIELDMVDAYKAFFDGTNIPLKEVILDAEFPLQDQFGNESDGSVYVTYLNRRVADKINWTEADYLEWSNLWTTTVLHPEFR